MTIVLGQMLNRLGSLSLKIKVPFKPVMSTEHGFIMRRGILPADAYDYASKIPHNSVRNDNRIDQHHWQAGRRPIVVVTDDNILLKPLVESNKTKLSKGLTAIRKKSGTRKQ